ncbi:hypothetical protein EH165_00995 [Nakamurella antarctica]|uniref:Uncharacterized protein n=1 Tax=Nakamurella antarctica TaxID=1902245 RepID=A0A3G8ZIF2_9ACTN|nr:hypothetical protein [Nakamurella antarctica]AZI56958.1 hypothetical protein EH165_00995 [Nakamurella antarctica]
MSAAATTFADALEFPGFFDGMDKIGQANALFNAGADLVADVVPLTVLCAWVLERDCRVYVEADVPVVAPGFPVTVEVDAGDRRVVRIAGAASVADVVASLEQAQDGLPGQGLDAIEGRFWFGPKIARCEKWCKSGHPAGPNEYCEQELDSVQTISGETVSIRVTRYRAHGLFTGQARIEFDGAQLSALSAETAVQFGGLIVLGSIIASTSTGAADLLTGAKRA